MDKAKRYITTIVLITLLVALGGAGFGYYGAKYAYQLLMAIFYSHALWQIAKALKNNNLISKIKC